MSIDIPQPVTILMDDSPILRMISSPVKDFDFGYPVEQVVAAMKTALDRRGGRGISAIQIGVGQRVLIIRERGQQDLVMVNPELLRVGRRYVEQHEGCLSIASFRWGKVWRPAKCDVSWVNTDGEHQQTATLTGETARIFQHEFDHLNGVLMTDKLA